MDKQLLIEIYRAILQMEGCTIDTSDDWSKHQNSVFLYRSDVLNLIEEKLGIVK